MKEKKHLLAAMGIDVWQQKTKDAAIEPSQTMTWEQLEHAAADCKLCELHKTCTHIVFGVGNRKAKIIFIGEAPGANEDLQGEPFVGRAGMLLNEMLFAIGLKRQDVYITNILKCRPPNNRDPLPSEIALCTSYLKQEIALVGPKLLVAVGRIAAQFLLNTTESMSLLRGKMHKYGEIPVIVTYHPAYLLRSPREKSKAYTDFKMIKDTGLAA